MKIRQTINCDHCGVVDFIEHMFIECKLLKGYWELVFDTIYDYTSKRFPKTNSNILIGFPLNLEGYEHKEINSANHIMLVAKMCISKQRYGKSINLRITFENEIKCRNKLIKLQ